MIDLTPLDVRTKRGDFKKIMRGYDPHEVDIFLELVAERLEVLVRENLQFRERMQALQDQVAAQAGREQAVQDALVTAQELRQDIRDQTQREADHVLKDAETEARRIISDAEIESRRLIAEADAEVRGRLRGIERQVDHANHTIEELERRRVRFIKEFRSLLERELDVVEVEESRAPFEDRAVELELGPRRGGSREAAYEAPAETADAGHEPEDTQGDAEGSSGPEATAEAEDDHTAEVLAAGMAAAAAVVSEEEVLEEITPDLDAPVDELAERVEHHRTADVPVLDPPASRPGAPPPNVGAEPSSLELELMARTDRHRRTRGGHHTGVPDLETVLAEAGVEEVTPPPAEEIAPPPIPASRDDTSVLFDPDDDDLLR